jgi:uncharacterized membrane protein
LKINFVISETIYKKYEYPEKILMWLKYIVRRIVLLSFELFIRVLEYFCKHVTQIDYIYSYDIVTFSDIEHI